MGSTMSLSSCITSPLIYCTAGIFFVCAFFAKNRSSVSLSQRARENERRRLCTLSVSRTHRRVQFDWVYFYLSLSLSLDAKLEEHRFFVVQHGLECSNTKDLGSLDRLLLHLRLFQSDHIHRLCVLHNRCTERLGEKRIQKVLLPHRLWQLASAEYLFQLCHGVVDVAWPCQRLSTISSTIFSLSKMFGE